VRALCGCDRSSIDPLSCIPKFKGSDISDARSRANPSLRAFPCGGHHLFDLMDQVAPTCPYVHAPTL